MIEGMLLIVWVTVYITLCLLNPDRGKDGDIYE